MPLIGSRWQPTGETLGGGGQAQVLVVTDSTRQLPGEWAAKVLVNATRMDRMRREIETARKLYQERAPVVQIVDDYLHTEPAASRAWFVMEIAKHGSLGRHLRSEPIYAGTVISALGLFRQIAGAVLDFHKRQVAHRDLKPDNILLGASREPILADLGLCLPLADIEGERLTGELERIGSLHYLPKEAFSKQPLDENQFAFDAYALGKILYQLVAGRMLPGFTPPNDADYDLAKLQNSPLYRGISRAVRGLLHDAPAVRIATLGQLVELIGDLIEPVNAEKGPETGTREILLRAADALAVRMAVAPQPPVANQTLQHELDSIRDDIFSAWSQSATFAEIENVIVQPNSDRLEIAREDRSRKLREVLTMPGVRSRRALEPIEDLGFPVLPTLESGCAVGVKPRPDGPKIVAMWLGALVAARGEKVTIATASVVCSPENLGPRDILLGTQEVEGVDLADASLVSKVRAIAERGMQRFASALAEQLSVST